jgi:hypothetical protein
MISSSIHFSENDIISFSLCLINTTLNIHVKFYLTIHQLAGTQAISKAQLLLINMGVQVSLICWFTFLWLYAKSGIAGSNIGLFLNFLMGRHTDFHRSCTSLHFPLMVHECSLHSHQHLLLFVFLMIAILGWWDGISESFWFSFLFCISMSNISHVFIN